MATKTTTDKAAPTKTVEAAKTETATTKAKTNTAAKKDSKANKVADIFKRNPLRKQVFQTSDGFYFINKPLAKKHAATLSNKKVEVVTKTQNQPSADESSD